MGLLDTATNVGNGIYNAGKGAWNTTAQVGRNFRDDPMKFITHDGIGATGRALKNGAEKSVESIGNGINNFINDSVEINGGRADGGHLVPVNHRKTPEKGARNGDRNGSSVLRNHIKQEAFNTNIYGGSIDIVG